MFFFLILFANFVEVGAMPLFIFVRDARLFKYIALESAGGRASARELQRNCEVDVRSEAK